MTGKVVAGVGGTAPDGWAACGCAGVGGRPNGRLGWDDTWRYGRDRVLVAEFGVDPVVIAGTAGGCIVAVIVAVAAGGDVAMDKFVD